MNYFRKSTILLLCVFFLTFISESQAAEMITEKAADTSYDFTVCFAGDINLDENWCTTQYMSAQPNGIYDCISEKLVSFMKDTDIMCLNNEFSYSTQGKPLEGKAYTLVRERMW